MFKKILQALRQILEEESLTYTYDGPSPSPSSSPNTVIKVSNSEQVIPRYKFEDEPAPQAMPMSGMICDSCNGRRFTVGEKDTWECEFCGALYMDEREQKETRIETRYHTPVYSYGSSVAYPMSASYLSPWDG